MMTTLPSISVCVLITKENNDFFHSLTDGTLFGRQPEEILILCVMDSIPEHWNRKEHNTQNILINQKTFPFLFLPSTEKENPIVSSISELVNIGLSYCTKDWILLLNEGEQIQDLSQVWNVCKELEYSCSDFALSPTFGKGMSTFRPRLVKNTGYAQLDGVAQLQFLNSKKTTIITDKLSSQITKVSNLYAPQNRAIRLHRSSREGKNNLPSDTLELALLSFPTISDNAWYASGLIRKYLEDSFYLEERCWACSIAGIVHERVSESEIWKNEEVKANHRKEALQWFERALEEWPSWKAALRLCKFQFKLQNWNGVLDAFDIALENKDQLNLIDPLDESVIASLSFVAEAYNRLGDKELAIKTCETLIALAPGKPGVEQHYKTIKGES